LSLTPSQSQGVEPGRSAMQDPLLQVGHHRPVSIVGAVSGVAERNVSRAKTLQPRKRASRDADLGSPAGFRSRGSKVRPVRIRSSRPPPMVRRAPKSLSMIPSAASSGARRHSSSRSARPLTQANPLPPPDSRMSRREAHSARSVAVGRSRAAKAQHSQRGGGPRQSGRASSRPALSRQPTMAQRAGRSTSKTRSSKDKGAERVLRRKPGSGDPRFQG